MLIDINNDIVEGVDMMSNEYEAAFDRFLESSVCDEANEAVFALSRAAFLAGWLAAGGAPGLKMKIFEVLKSEKDEELR